MIPPLQAAEETRAQSTDALQAAVVHRKEKEGPHTPVQTYRRPSETADGPYPSSPDQH